MENLLPIGSVVKIRGTKKPIMIFGMLQKSGMNGKLVDYIGVPFPEGNVGIYAQLGFQRSDIDEVLFEGYHTEEVDVWLERIKQYGSTTQMSENAKE